MKKMKVIDGIKLINREKLILPVTLAVLAIIFTHGRIDDEENL